MLRVSPENTEEVAAIRAHLGYSAIRKPMFAGASFARVGRDLAGIGWQLKSPTSRALSPPSTSPHCASSISAGSFPTARCKVSSCVSATSLRRGFIGSGSAPRAAANPLSDARAWPAMQPPAARAEALKAAGEFASGTPIVGKADAVTFSAAFARYVEICQGEGDQEGQARHAGLQRREAWQDNASGMGRWTLADMAKRPDIVADWYGAAPRKPRLRRALRAGSFGRSIAVRPSAISICPARLPTSAIEFEGYKPSQIALDFGDYPAWRAKGEEIESQIERGYHLFCFVTGIRPGEAAQDWGRRH